MRFAIPLALMVVCGTLAVASPAPAQEARYALTTIENPTNQTLIYSCRWGDGDWQAYSLSPGAYRIHSWRYADGLRSSPPFTVRFDCTLYDDIYVGKEYTLMRCAASCIDRSLSKRYVFRKSLDGSFVDLYAVN